MPMLTTLRIGLPVWPVHAPLRTRLAKSAIRSSTAWTSGTTFSPSTRIDALARGAQRHVEHGPLLGDVDLVAARTWRRCGRAGSQSSARRTSSGSVSRRDPVLRIIEIDARRLERQPFAASRIAREQLAQMDGPDVAVVLDERLPGRFVGEPSAFARGHRADLPQAEAADERQGVRARAAALRQFLQFLDVAAADDDVVRSDRLDHPRRAVLDVLLPLLPAQPAQGAVAEVILVGAVLERQVGQLHGDDDAIGHHRGAQAGAEAEKQHQPALVAAERLHRRVVDDPDRAAECGSEIEADPPASEVVRLLDDAAVADASRVADRDRVVLPVRDELLDARDQLLRRQRPARRELPRHPLSGREDLHVRPADVDDQHAHPNVLAWLS